MLFIRKPKTFVCGNKYFLLHDLNLSFHFDKVNRHKTKRWNRRLFWIISPHMSTSFHWKNIYSNDRSLSSLFSDAATRLLLLFKLWVIKLLLLSMKLLLFKFVDVCSLLVIDASLPPKSINLSSFPFDEISDWPVDVLS